MSQKANSKTCSFSVCSHCVKSCCQDAKPPLTRARIVGIVEFLKCSESNVAPNFSYEDYSFPSVDQDEFCLFYNKETKKCLIHQVKPETCQAGPITFDINFQTLRVEWFLKNNELCILAGKLFEHPERLEEHLKVAKVQLLSLIHELDSNDLKAILKREEPDTFKIGEDALPKEVISKLGLQ